MVILLFFSFLTASALASATHPILQGACQPVFNTDFTRFLTNCPFLVTIWRKLLTIFLSSLEVAIKEDAPYPFPSPLR